MGIFMQDAWFEHWRPICQVPGAGKQFPAFEDLDTGRAVFMLDQRFALVGSIVGLGICQKDIELGDARFAGDLGSSWCSRVQELRWLLEI